jgi:hypothetical protein
MADAQVYWLDHAGELRGGVEAVKDAEDGLVARLPTQLIVGQTVWVRSAVGNQKGFVRSCLPSGETFLTAVQILSCDRRREDRYPVVGQGTLKWNDGRLHHTSAVQVCNVTPEGVRVRLDRELHSGQMVRLSGETWECIGAVRYCEPEGGHYWALGLEILGSAYPKDAADYKD